MIDPVRPRREADRSYRGVRYWWREYVSTPLDRMYARLDEKHRHSSR